MENKPRTIDEFFIEKYKQLEEETKNLQKAVDHYIRLLDKEREESVYWKAKYEALIEMIKEDFKIVLRYSTALEGEKVISADNIIFEQHLKEKFDFYKKLFNLKEEGEEENEQ